MGFECKRLFTSTMSGMERESDAGGVMILSAAEGSTTQELSWLASMSRFIQFKAVQISLRNIQGNNLALIETILVLAQ